MKDAFTRLKLIGKGASGIVYEGINNETKEIVAMKLIRLEDQDQRERILREISNLEKLRDSKYIVKIIGWYEEKNVICIIQEYCEQGDLYNYLRENPNITEKEKYRLVHQLLKAVRFSHSCNIIHRDIKPANILLKNNKIKLSDFGLAKEVIGFSPMTFCGTPAFMSPESYQNRRYDFKSDIWSIGGVCYYIFKRSLPYKAKNFKILDQIQREYPDFSGLTQQEIEFLQGIFIYDPKKRSSIDQLFQSHVISQIKNKNYKLIKNSLGLLADTTKKVQSNNKLDVKSSTNCLAAKDCIEKVKKILGTFENSWGKKYSLIKLALWFYLYSKGVTETVNGQIKKRHYFNLCLETLTEIRLPKLDQELYNEVRDTFSKEIEYMRRHSPSYADLMTEIHGYLGRFDIVERFNDDCASIVSHKLSLAH
jgi:serine/threonine protein kinase